LLEVAPAVWPLKMEQIKRMKGWRTLGYAAPSAI
jgi:hypothetical protein